LRKNYFRIANEKEYKIKKTIASSIAEVAEILGPSITEKDLLPIFEKLSREQSILIYIYFIELLF